MNNPRLTSDWM